MPGTWLVIAFLLWMAVGSIVALAIGRAVRIADRRAGATAARNIALTPEELSRRPVIAQRLGLTGAD